MRACREYRGRPPIGVVGGIGDELIVERQRAPFVEVIGIVCLEDFLWAVVQLAITDQQTDTTRSEEVTVCVREPVDPPPNSDCVIRPPPGGALDRHTA